MFHSADDHRANGADDWASSEHKRPSRGKRLTRAERRAARNPPPRWACPCCDDVTLAERGRHLICPICYREDEDVFYDADTLEPSAANHGLTHPGARGNFCHIGACEASMPKNVLANDKRAAILYMPRDE